MTAEAMGQIEQALADALVAKVVDAVAGFPGADRDVREEIVRAVARQLLAGIGDE